MAAKEYGLSVDEFSVPISACLVSALPSLASSSTCLTHVHVVLRWQRIFFLVPLQDGPILSLSPVLYLVAEDSVDTHRLSDTDQKNVCTAFSQHFCDDHAHCTTMGSLRCDHLFSLWAFLVWKYMGLLSAY